MARPISAAMLRALEKVAAGVPPYRAAREEGLSPTAVYVMRKKLRERSNK